MAGIESPENKKQMRKQMIRDYLLERGNEASIIRKIVAIIALILIIAGAATVFGGYLYIHSALQPMDPDNNKKLEIEVPIGSSSTSIGQLLEKKGIIKNGLIFKYYVKVHNISGFQAGNYHFSPSMTLEEITTALQTGKLGQEAVFKIAIPEGLQLDQIAEAIAKKTDYSKKEILKKMTDGPTIKEFSKKYPELLTKDIQNKEILNPLEGYLFPATYSFYEEKPSIETIIDVMLKQTSEVLANYQEEMANQNIAVHELLTMASLVEKEATETTDRKKIASVFFNRLDQNMMLQTDPTVLYALGEHKERTVYDDLDVDSPYNTYKYKGLPPGPIANAGKSSIEAVLHPAKTDYLYFLAEYGSGKVHYAKTLEEHNALKKKYITDKRDAE